MNLEVINTGTELLLGDTINTHAGWIGQAVLPLGLRIARQLAIPDGEIIRQALLETVGRADIVVVTGGLGPTSDDITRELTAELLGMPLQEDPAVTARIAERLARMKREMNPHTHRQTMVPVGATVLHNDHGTAPGLYFPPSPVAAAGGVLSPHLILLPGPPRELKPMWENAVDPILRRICQGRTRIRQMKNFRLTGIGETQVSTTVEDPILSLGDVELGYCAKAGEVIVRVIGEPAQLAAAETILCAEFPQQYFSADGSVIELKVVDLLTRLGQTVSVAESCTGGFVTHRLTNVPGASAVLGRAFVTYANEAKRDLLGVPEELLAAHGAVSEEVCRAMAEGCLRASGADHAIALTGIAGPGGGSEEKPVGTVFIGLASRDGATVIEHRTNRADRQTFKQLASQQALDLLRRRLMRMV